MQYLHAHSSIRNNKCPKATSHDLFAPASQPSWLQDSVGYTEKGNHWVTLMPAKGKLSLGLVIESSTWSQESSPQNLQRGQTQRNESESAQINAPTAHHKPSPSSEVMARYLRTMRTFDCTNFFSGIKLSCLRTQVGHREGAVAPRAAISQQSKHLHLPCGLWAWALPRGEPKKPQVGEQE